MPQLNTLLSGPIYVNLATQSPGEEVGAADLSKAQLSIPWAGWTKGAGVGATATFTLRTNNGRTEIKGLDVSGDTFRIRGDLTIGSNGLSSANFKEVRLNKGDSATVRIDRVGGGYKIDIAGGSFDARAMIKHLADSYTKSGQSSGNPYLSIHAALDHATGFNGEVLSNVDLSYEGVAGSKTETLSVEATTASGARFTLSSATVTGPKTVTATCVDAGAILRFFDLYSRMKGGNLHLSLAAQDDGPLRGTLEIKNFTIVQDPSLAQLVSARPVQGGRSLNEAVDKQIDVSSVVFNQAFSRINIKDGYVRLDRGVLRGPSIGTTFQGTLLDPDGNMSITGTFMPAYGLNSILGSLPLVGQILGNGRERGLIGITYKMEGPAKNPQVRVNPISVIAPGVFRSIFEFR